MYYEAAHGSTVSWATKPYAEISSIATRDGSVLFVPVGSVEQHGHHLPVSTDTLLVDAVTNAAAQRADAEGIPSVVTPPLWAGFSPHHTSLGGTITLPHDDLLATIEDVADSALEAGFETLFLVNGHGGNASLVDSAVSTIGDAHSDVEVLGTTYFNLAAPFVDSIRESDSGGMAHGGEFETSLMLHLYPDLVDRDSLEAEPLSEPYDHGMNDMFDGGPLAVYREFAEYSDSGAIGDPGLATAAKGEQLFERLCDELVAIVRQTQTS
ncbi:creatininase family protein [Natrarchaeobius chitinivorans]|uniref:Creatininase family protein n=1 Tax=Natrarchaeobius chitinivorans TaxID=1679083 RepID=A0A3N6PAY6_NATCH|nr:creatininase family protein [Natrarchaeobius chitinivorans]RQG93635.1 creatininase family protein [Natrarchaeobius chitinivorans]